jgi:D-glycero-alpha-D-manno-heptose-7-phosphate kinase
MVDHIDEIQHELIREALRKTNIVEGIEITTMGDIPSQGSGLGSSSTVTVGALHAMYSYLGELVSAERLAKEACEIEIGTLHKPIGIQDQYIVAYGGLRFLEFSTDGEVHNQCITLTEEQARHLNDNTMSFYTGVTRRSGLILNEQKSNISQRRAVLSEMKAIAYTAKDELVSGNIDCIGELLDATWQLKKRLATKVSNGSIDEIYKTARRAGALGGKISGAGGGGFLLLYCPYERQHAVREALRPLQELPFKIESSGSKVIFDYRR